MGVISARHTPGMSSRKKTKVAIACQGGGSHAAYGAGVLTAFLREPWFREQVDLVGISGTSGGAVCAALFWPGPTDDPASSRKAMERLDAFWNDLSDPLSLNQALNVGAQWFSRFGRFAMPGVFSAEASNPIVSWWCETSMRVLLERHIEVSGAGPKLFVGATDIDKGERVVFEHSAAQPITARHIIASAAVPPLYMSQWIAGTRYWDGLFTSNPPVRELAKSCKPDEIWIIRINPRRRSVAELLPDDMLDRRNELAGNTALDREIEGIEAVNDALRYAGKTIIERPGKPDFKPIEIFCVKEPELPLDLTSKFDISRSLITDLRKAGEDAGKEFVSGRRSASLAVPA